MSWIPQLLPEGTNLPVTINYLFISARALNIESGGNPYTLRRGKTYFCGLAR